MGKIQKPKRILKNIFSNFKKNAGVSLQDTLQYCTKCGMGNVKGANFCASCGSAMIKIGEQYDMQNYPVPQPQIQHEKIIAKQEDMDFNDVLARYLTTDHSRVPSKYSYISYYKAEFDCIIRGIPKHEISVSSEKVNRNNEIMLAPNYLPIRANTNVKKLKDFVSIDVETTGLHPGGGDIIEVSAIKWIDFNPVSVFSTLCKPRNPIPTEASSVNGIYDDMVADSPTFKEISSDLDRFIGNLPIVAHNAKFDLKFLFVCGMKSAGTHDVYDTLDLSRSIVRDYDGTKLDSYKLSDVCNQLYIRFDNSHRANADCLATGLLFIELIKIKKSTDNVMSLL